MHAKGWGGNKRINTSTSTKTGQQHRKTQLSETTAIEEMKLPRAIKKTHQHLTMYIVNCIVI